MCPALNSNPYWSYKQVVPLLSCCSDALGFPGNRLVIYGDRTFFQLNFWVQSKLEFLPGKNCCTFATRRDRKSDHLMHRSCQVWACIALESHATANQQTFPFKNCQIWPKITIFCKLGPIFVYWFHYTYVNIRAPSSLVLKSKHAVMTRYPGCPSDLV